MHRPKRPFLLLVMLLAIGLRTVLGAPCCAPDAAAAEPAAAHHAHAQHTAYNEAQDQPGHRDHQGHQGHGDDASANPCCSACGPTLPPETAQIAQAKPVRTAFEPAPIRALAKRPPFPAYDATGPPILT